MEGEHADTVLLAVVAWLCSLPLVLLLAVPLLGWRAGGLLALLWFGLAVVACFGVCVHRLRQGKFVGAPELTPVPTRHIQRDPDGSG